MPNIFDELTEQLGLTNAPVPLPQARQKPVVPSPPLAPLPSAPVARLPRPRPQAPVSADPFAAMGAELGVVDQAPSPFSALESELLGGAERPIAAAQPSSQGAEGVGRGEGQGGELPLSGGEPSSAPSFLQSALKPVTAAGRGVARGFNRAQQGGRAIQLAYPQISIRDRGELVEEFIQQGKEAESYPYSAKVIQGALDYQKAEGVWSKAKVLMANPEFLADVLGESVGQSPLSIAGGVAGATAGPIGAAGGIGAGSGITEYMSALSSFLADKKEVDLSDPEQVDTAFANKEWLDEAKSWALKRGVSVGSWDALTSLIAPKVFSKIETRAGKVPAAAGGLTTEAAGGAGGEATAQLATEGQINGGDILLEAVGELAGGAPELGISLFSRRTSTRPQVDLRTPTGGEVDEAFGMETPPRVVTPEEAEAEGRTLFGFDTGEGTVEVGTYDDAERNMAEKGARRGKLVAVPAGGLEEAAPRLDYNKVKKANADDIEALTITGPKAELTRKLLHNLADPNTEERPSKSTEKTLKKFLDSGQVKIDYTPAADLWQTSKIFRGDSRDLGVTPREIDYARLSIDPEKLQPGELIRKDFKVSAPFDIDLKKVKPGNLLPQVGGLIRFVEGNGEQVLRDMALRAGSMPAAVETMLGELRGGGSTFQTRDALVDGSLVLPMMFDCSRCASCTSSL